jgi:carbon-monoxide dehydrogenase medium subunit
VSHLRQFEYVEARSVDEALCALASFEDARLVGGGTVVVPTMKLRLIQPDALVSLRGVEDLSAVEPDGERIRIGAMVTHHRLARSDLVRSRVPMLAAACGRVASPTIRRMGTLGGNVCYGESASDPAPVLLALGAEMTVRGPTGERTISAHDFYVGYYETALERGEILTSVAVPSMSANAKWRYWKWSPRAHEDKPLVGLAVCLEMQEGSCRTARLAVGGVEQTPVLLEAAASALEGKDLTPEVVREAVDAAMSAIDPMEDFQASAAYRREMVGVWVRRVLTGLAWEAA